MANHQPKRACRTQSPDGEMRMPIVALSIKLRNLHSYTVWRHSLESNGIILR